MLCSLYVCLSNYAAYLHCTQLIIPKPQRQDGFKDKQIMNKQRCHHGNRCNVGKEMSLMAHSRMNPQTLIDCKGSRFYQVKSLCNLDNGSLWEAAIDPQLITHQQYSMLHFLYSSEHHEVYCMSCRTDWRLLQLSNCDNKSHNVNYRVQFLLCR